MDCSPPGSSVHGILQIRTLEWVAMPFSRGSSQPRVEPASLMSPALVGRFFTTSSPKGLDNGGKMIPSQPKVSVGSWGGILGK